MIGGSIMNILLLVVVMTTTIFLYVKIRNTEKELRDTQKLLLEFIDHFEEQYRELSEQIPLTGEKKVQHEVKSQQNQKDMEDRHTVEDQHTDKGVESLTDDPLSLKMRYAEIIERMQEGKSIEEIAKEIGRGTGEVQLIVELLETRKRAKTSLDNDS